MNAAVLLAAGGGTRFDGATHKLLARLDASSDRPAETLVERSLATCLEAGLDHTVLVTGAVRPDVDTDRDPDLRLHVVHNAEWESGQMSSVRLGIDTARDLGATQVVIGLADQPGVTTDTWRAIAAHGHDSPIVVATYDGRRGNPVSLRSDVWDLLPDDGDEGARSLMRIRADLVREVPCDGSADDIDTVEDLESWQSS